VHSAPARRDSWAFWLFCPGKVVDIGMPPIELYLLIISHYGEKVSYNFAWLSHITKITEFDLQLRELYGAIIQLQQLSTHGSYCFI
jgi:hypothetical protein